MPRGIPSMGRPNRKQVPDGTPIPSMVHYDPDPEALVQPAYDEVDQIFDDLKDLKTQDKVNRKAAREKALRQGMAGMDSMTDDGPFFC